MTTNTNFFAYMPIPEELKVALNVEISEEDQSAVGGIVTSVFGRGGAITAASGDYSSNLITYDNTASGLSSIDVKAALDELDSDITGISIPVSSVHGRTGAVVAAASDYDAGQVDYDNTTSGLTATDTQAAIDEVASASAVAMTGASAGAAGTGGTVPAPVATQQGLFLRGDGTWAALVPDWTLSTAYSAGAVVTLNNILYRKNSAGSSGAVFTPALWTAITAEEFGGATSGVAGSAGIAPAPAAGEQNQFLSGSGVWTYILPDWAATTQYTANDTVVNDGAIYRKIATGASGATFTPALWTLISAGEVFTGATNAAAGTAGEVPAPVATQQDLVLHGDGSWRESIPDWTAATTYSLGAIVTNSGSILRKNATNIGTPSEATFDATEETRWDALGTGGLAKKGTITTDADDGEGIYNLDSSGGAFNFTLPTATGSQERRMLVGEDLTNAVTIAVQVGDALNGVVDDTESFDLTNDVLLAIDSSSAGWSLVRLGQETAKVLSYKHLSMSSVDGSGIVTWSEVFTQGSGITLAATQLQLTEGKTYRMESSYINTASTSDTWNWRLNGTTAIGTSGIQNGESSTGMGSVPAVAYHTAAASDYVELISVDVANGYATIEELPIAVVETVTTPTFIGAMAAVVGVEGIVPAPAAGQQDNVLHGDGSWREVIPAWSATTSYSEGALVTRSNMLLQATVAFTSGASFVGDNWDVLNTGNISVGAAAGSGIVTYSEQNFADRECFTFNTIPVNTVNLPSTTNMNARDQDLKTTLIFTEASTVTFDEPVNGAASFNGQLSFTAPVAVTVFYSPTNNSYTCTPTSSGGLVPNGDLPAAVLVQGIYNAEGTNTASTLFAATGSQNRVMVVSESTHGNTVIGVEAGESLNGVTDGTYTTQADGEILLFIDKATGEWEVTVLGTGSTPDRVTPVVFSDLSATGVTLLEHVGSIATSNPGTGQMNWVNDGGSTITRIADKAIITFNFEWDDDSIITLTFGTNIVPTGGKIVSYSNSYAFTETSVTISSSVISDNQITLNRNDTIDSDTKMSVTMITDGWPVFEERVLAGMVAPEALSRIQVGLTVTTNNSGSSHYNFDETHFVTSGTNPLTLSGTGSIQGLTAGKTYKLSWHGTSDAPSGSGNSVFRFVDLTGSAQIGETWEVLSVQTAVPESSQGSAIAFFTPSVTTEVGVDFAAGAIGEMSATSTFTVEELPSSTVVHPDTVPVQTLNRARLRQATGALTGAGVDTLLTPDATDYNVGSMVAGGIVTIPAGGGGLYLINVSGGNSVASNNTQMFVEVNGTKTMRSRNSQASGGNLDTLAFSTTLELSDGDTIQMGIFTNGVETTPTSLSDQPTLEVIQLANSSVIDPATVPVLDEDDFASDSDTSVPTQQSVKAYVDGGLLNIQSFNSSGTYTPTAGTKRALVYVTGGGGGGGGAEGTSANTSCGNGGAAGGTRVAMLTIDADTPITGTVTIGAGGSGGAVGGGTGTSGTASTLLYDGTTITGSGGAGGTTESSTANARFGLIANGGGGSGGTAAYTIRGGAGGIAQYANQGNYARSGDGGNSYWGNGAEGGRANGTNTSFTGNNASDRGAGGGGALATENTNRGGGDGQDGTVIIHEYK